MLVTNLTKKNETTKSFPKKKIPDTHTLAEKMKKVRIFCNFLSHTCV